MNSTVNHNVFAAKTQSSVFILAKEQVSDSENNVVLHAKKTQKGLSSTVPLSLLRFYKNNMFLSTPAVFNEP